MFDGIRSAQKLLRRKTQSRAKRHDDDFETDGCTGVPDFWFFKACKKHDRAYWEGGYEEDRLEADRELRQDIQDASVFGRFSPWSHIVYAGVRKFGRQHFNYHDRGGPS